MQDAVKETIQHFRLGIRISSFLEVVSLGKDKLFESAWATLFRDLLGKEGDIALVETCARVKWGDLQEDARLLTFRPPSGQRNSLQ